MSTPRTILSCGCPSAHGGFPSTWDETSREGEPAIAYGVLCERHFEEFDARPAPLSNAAPLSEEAILALWGQPPYRLALGRLKIIAFARALEAAHGIKDR